MLQSFENNVTSDRVVELGHGLGRATLHCEDCEEEEEEEEQEEEQEVVEETAEIPEFPEPCYYCVKRGDSVFSIASKFHINSMLLHRTDDWNFDTNGTQYVSSSNVMFDRARRIDIFL